VASLRTCQKLPPCLIKPVPAGSTGAKAEPISNGGSASEITYLRRGEKKLCNSIFQQESENSADTKVSAEGGGGGAPGNRAEIPLQSVEQITVRQAAPLQPMEVHGGAAPHL